jgi:hypothetical protein
MINLEDIVNQVKAVEETRTENEKGGYKGDERLLSLKKNCTYTVRLMPNIKDVDNTFVTYKEIGFTSRVDNSFIFGGRSPSDAGIKEDPYKATQWKHYSEANKAGDDAEKKASYKLLGQRKQLVNAYLVSVDGDDPEGKEKVGKVVVVRYPAQLDKTNAPISDVFKRIHGAIFGDMSKKIGTKALDLSEKGKSLIIKVTEKGGYHNYSETMFDDAETLGLSQERIVELLQEAHDLKTFIPEVKPVEEIKEILSKHWFGESASPDDEMDDEDEDEDEAPVVKKSKSVKLNSKKVDKEEDEIPMGDSADDDLDELLKD